MKVLIIGVDSLPNYKNKTTGALDPSVIVHMITKSDNGFNCVRTGFFSTSSNVFKDMLKVAGNVESMVGFYGLADFNQKGFITDIQLSTASGMTIPWK